MDQNDAQKDEQIKIIQSITTGIPVRNDKDLLQVVAKWRLYLGIPKTDENTTTIELALIRDFILEEYKILTNKEIELAYNLAAKRKLDDCEFYGQFTPFYVGSVLNSYLYYRKIVLADVIYRKERYYELPNKAKPTLEEEANMMISLFNDFYKKHKEGKIINDVFNFCWEYLRKNKLINPSKQEVEEALKFANENYDKKFEEGQLFEKYKLQKDDDIKKLARNYCVQKFFDKINFDEFIKNIKPENFKK